jgi:hypothetical protein
MKLDIPLNMYVRDGERISICMRLSDGARKINRHGGAIFIHDDWREEKGIGVRLIAYLPQSPIAPVEIRDFIYGKLIELSPATLYPGVLIAGEKGLLARGLSKCHIGNYGGLAAGSRERDRIAQHRLSHQTGGQRRFPMRTRRDRVVVLENDQDRSHVRFVLSR